MTTKTYKEEKIERENKIVEHFAGLIFQGFSNSEATSATMIRFKIYSRSTLWAIKKRVAERYSTK